MEGGAARGAYDFSGFADYDPKRRAFTRFDLVALGDVRDESVAEYYQRLLGGPESMMGIAYELAAPGSLGYETPPIGIYRHPSPGYWEACGPDGKLNLGHPGLQWYFQADR